VQSRSVDVLILAEFVGDPNDLTGVLTDESGADWRLPESFAERILILTRLPANSITDQFNSSLDRVTIRRLRLTDRCDLLLAAAHLPDKRNWLGKDQAMEAQIVARDIALTEDRVGHRRTMFVGDFNMNPFESGLTGSHAFNAVMTRDAGRAERRKVVGQEYRFFYNPMWSLLGDRSEGPPGTYFDGSSRPTNHYWHMLDQVLLRPAIMDKLRELAILESDGEESLVTRRGRPRKSAVADHLPLYFALDY